MTGCGPQALSSAELPHSAEEMHIVGMPAPTETVTTIDELLALPEDGMRHELLDGEHVVTPAPALPHQRMAGQVFLTLSRALEGRDDLLVFTSPADIVLGPKTLVQPDLFVIAHEPGKPPQSWADVGVPVLGIEVLSPSTASRDRGSKRRIYQRAGVDEYWIVDLDARLVERWRPDDERPEICDTELSWAPHAGPTVTIDLPALFAKVLGG